MQGNTQHGGHEPENGAYPGRNPAKSRVTEQQPGRCFEGRPEQRLQNRCNDRARRRACENDRDRYPVATATINAPRHGDSQFIARCPAIDGVTERVEPAAPRRDQHERVGTTRSRRSAAWPACCIISVRWCDQVSHRTDRNEALARCQPSGHWYGALGAMSAAHCAHSVGYRVPVLAQSVSDSDVRSHLTAGTSWSRSRRICAAGRLSQLRTEFPKRPRVKLMARQ